MNNKYINLLATNGTSIIELRSDNIEITCVQDALDMMAECNYRGSNKIILNIKNIIPEFFDLKTGIAGEILQKFSNYGVYLAITGSFEKFTSKSLRSFILESNKQKQVVFVESVRDAITMLSE